MLTVLTKTYSLISRAEDLALVLAPGKATDLMDEEVEWGGNRE